MDNIMIQAVIGILSSLFLIYIKTTISRSYKNTDEKMELIRSGIEKLTNDYHDLKIELVEKVGKNELDNANLKTLIENLKVRVENLEKISDRRVRK